MSLPSSKNPLTTPRAPSETERLEVGFAGIFAGPGGIRAGWRWLIFLFIGFMCTSLLVSMGVDAGTLHLPLGTPSIANFTGTSLMVQGASQFVAMLIAAWIMSKIEQRPMDEYGLPIQSAFGRKFWQGAVWGFAAVTLTMLLIAGFHGFSFGAIALSGAALGKYAAVWAATFLLTGFSEEFLFRGYSQFTLAQGMHFWPAAILLSALFGASHLCNAGEAWPGALSAGLIGLFFCFTLRRTGSIWFAVGLHAAWDYGETFIYGVPDSGFVAQGHLLNSSFHGPRWLTGGAVGPEASVFCFVVVALMFLTFHFAYPSQSETGS